MSKNGFGLGQHSAFYPVMGLHQFKETAAFGSRRERTNCNRHYITGFEMKNGSSEPFLILLAEVHRFIGGSFPDDKAKRDCSGRDQ